MHQPGFCSHQREFGGVAPSLLSKQDQNQAFSSEIFSYLTKLESGIKAKVYISTWEKKSLNTYLLLKSSTDFFKGKLCMYLYHHGDTTFWSNSHFPLNCSVNLFGISSTFLITAFRGRAPTTLGVKSRSCLSFRPNTSFHSPLIAWQLRLICLPGSLKFITMLCELSLLPLDGQ